MVQALPSSQAVPSGALFGPQYPLPSQVSGSLQALSAELPQDSPAATGDNTHPLVGSHVSEVQAFPSSHEIGVWKHPAVGAHESAVHAFSSSHSPAPYAFALPFGPETWP